MNKKLLLVDNDHDYLVSLADYLEAVGYEVYRAETIERARQLLDYVWVHVAIVDIRLRNDRDPKDESGLLLAKDAAYRSIPKVMLTRYPTIAAVREALGHALNGLPPAVDFIDKRDTDPKVILDALDNAFKQHTRINFDLQVAWSQPLSFPALINLLQAEHDNTRLLDRCAELEDLLRRLFYENKQITIGRVLQHGAERLVLEIFAYTDAGAERQYVVSCGKKSEIADETRRHSEIAPQTAGNHSTIKVAAVETVRFAATAYMLSGDLEDISSFREYYQGKPATMIEASLHHLYESTLLAWHQKGRRQLTDGSLSSRLRESLGVSGEQLAPESLGRQIEAIAQHMLASGLVQGIALDSNLATIWFHGNEPLIFPNPSAQRYQQGMETDSAALGGFIHGKIDADSILVDSAGQVWLIDFSRAGWGPLVQDFVLLETTIKLDLLDTLDLHTRYQLDQRLLAAESLTEPLNDSQLPAELQRALVAIEAIRSCAATLAGAPLDAYNIGLYYCSLSYLASYQAGLQYARRRLLPYAHALLHVAMLAEHVAGAPAEQPDPGDSFVLDETNQVALVEQRRVELTAQEYAILAYLYQHAGRLCTRQEIMHTLFGIEYDFNEESRLNSAVSRLRLKLEPDPNHPKYLLTVRGRGYRLNVPSPTS